MDSQQTKPIEQFAPPQISVHNGVTVISDHHLIGGTKSRYIIDEFDENDELVYASPVEGGAQTALAWCAKLKDKKATILVAARKEEHPRVKLSRMLGANVIEVEHGRLNVVSCRARQYVQQQYRENNHKIKLLKFGLDTEKAIDVIAKTALSIQLPEPDEIWFASGSGILARGLKKAWPHARRVAILVGRKLSEQELDGAIPIFPKMPFSKASAALTPFSSDRHYDAKAWEMSSTFAKPKSTYFWNVAGAAEDLLQKVT